MVSATLHTIAMGTDNFVVGVKFDRMVTVVHINDLNKWNVNTDAINAKRIGKRDLNGRPTVGNEHKAIAMVITKSILDRTHDRNSRSSIGTRERIKTLG